MRSEQIDRWVGGLNEVCAYPKVPECLLHIDPMEHCHARIVLINDVAQDVRGLFNIHSTEALRHIEDALYSGLMESVVQAARHIPEG